MAEDDKTIGEEYRGLVMDRRTVVTGIAALGLLPKNMIAVAEKTGFPRLLTAADFQATDRVSEVLFFAKNPVTVEEAVKDTHKTIPDDPDKKRLFGYHSSYKAFIDALATLEMLRRHPDTKKALSLSQCAPSGKEVSALADAVHDRCMELREAGKPLTYDIFSGLCRKHLGHDAKKAGISIKMFKAYEESDEHVVNMNHTPPVYAGVSKVVSNTTRLHKEWLSELSLEGTKESEAELWDTHYPDLQREYNLLPAGLKALVGEPTRERITAEIEARIVSKVLNNEGG